MINFDKFFIFQISKVSTKKISDQLNEIKLNLTTINKLPNVLEKFRENNNIPPDKSPFMTFGIDAFSFRTFI